MAGQHVKPNGTAYGGLSRELSAIGHVLCMPGLAQLYMLYL